MKGLENAKGLMERFYSPISLCMGMLLLVKSMFFTEREQRITFVCTCSLLCNTLFMENLLE